AAEPDRRHLRHELRIRSAGAQGRWLLVGHGIDGGDCAGAGPAVLAQALPRAQRPLTRLCGWSVCAGRALGHAAFSDQTPEAKTPAWSRGCVIRPAPGPGACAPGRPI